jgi:acyl carrier protein
VQQRKINRVARDDIAGSQTRLRGLLATTLGLSARRVAEFDADTELFGALPEFDSMAVATLLTGIEEEFDVLIEDDDVEAEDFATFGALAAFVGRLTDR